MGLISKSMLEMAVPEEGQTILAAGQERLEQESLVLHVKVMMAERVVMVGLTFTAEGAVLAVLEEISTMELAVPVLITLGCLIILLVLMTDTLLVAEVVAGRMEQAEDSAGAVLVARVTVMMEPMGKNTPVAAAVGLENLLVMGRAQTEARGAKVR